MTLGTPLAFVVWMEATWQSRRAAFKRDERPIRGIERDELVRKLTRKDPLKLVMALNAWAFHAKHIPGSLHFDTDEQVLSSLAKNDEIIVYCSAVACHASIALYHFLLDHGFANVRRYDGGISDWEAAGLPLEGEWIAEATLK